MNKSYTPPYDASGELSDSLRRAVRQPSESCQTAFRQPSESCQTAFGELPDSLRRAVRQLSDSCQRANFPHKSLWDQLGLVWFWPITSGDEGLAAGNKNLSPEPLGSIGPAGFWSITSGDGDFAAGRNWRQETSKVKSPKSQSTLAHLFGTFWGFNKTIGAKEARSPKQILVMSGFAGLKKVRSGTF